MASYGDLTGFPHYEAATFGAIDDNSNNILNGSGPSWLASNATTTPSATPPTAASLEWWEVSALLLAVVGIIGNSIVILVLCRPHRKGHSTDTLIAALALADFLTSIFITLRLVDAKVPDDPVAAQIYCKVIKSSVLMWICIYASIFTLTAISVERLLAVRYPYTVLRLFTVRRTGLVVAAIWVLSVLLKVPPHFTIHYAEGGGCTRKFHDAGLEIFYGVSVFLVQYLIPVVVMITAHVLTIRELRWHRRKSVVSCKGRHRLDRRNVKLLTARRRVMRMLFVVVVTFIVCWTPDQVEFLLINLGVFEKSTLKSPVHQSFIILAFVNSCANPFIYAARNAKFRRALKQLFVRTPQDKVQYVFGDAHDRQGPDSSETGAETNRV